MNKENWSKILEFSVVRDLADDELLINLENLLVVGIIMFDYQNIADD